MTKLNPLLYPSSIGFDRILDMLESVTVEKDVFPHHNVVKISENVYEVELAVAGYAEQDIDIQVNNNELVISGKIQEQTEREYIRRGIALRSFKKIVKLADTVEVLGAQLNNGILTVSLENVIPEASKPRKILIGKPKEKQLLVE